MTAMKDNHIIISLLVMLFFVELSNQYWMISTNNKLKNIEKAIAEYFEPILPEWEDAQEVK
jgi:hypothetical protein